MNDIATQYRIIAAGAGWIEKTVRGRVRFDGADRVSFLQALLTNEIASLQPGQGAYSAYLTPQGRMIADLHVFVRTDCVLADVPAASAPALVEAFDRLVFTEDVRIFDPSAEMRQLSVVGGRAAELIGRAFGVSAGALKALPAWSQLDAGGGFVARTDDLQERSWDVFLTANETASRAVRAPQP